MAVAYAAIANGGSVVRPRLGLRIEDSAGRALQELDAPTARASSKISPETAQRDPRRPPRRRERAGRHLDPGLRRASRSTSPARPAPPSRRRQADQSWYVALAPYPNPKYVVAVTDEAGGFGADTAAPMTRRILAALFDVKENRLVQGGGALGLMQASRRHRRQGLPGRPRRARFLRLDPLLLLATLGLIAASIYIVGTRHPGRHPGRPQLLPLPAGRVRRRRVRADAPHHRASTTRACASGSSASTAFLIASILLVLRAGRLGPRVEARDLASVPQLPAVRARQGAPGRVARGLHGRPDQAARTTARPPAGSCCSR